MHRLSVDAGTSGEDLRRLSLLRDDHVSLHPRFVHDLNVTDISEFSATKATHKEPAPHDVGQSEIDFTEMLRCSQNPAWSATHQSRTKPRGRGEEDPTDGRDGSEATGERSDLLFPIYVSIGTCVPVSPGEWEPDYHYDRIYYVP